MSHDAQEAMANAVVGLAISMIAVWMLRRSGAWGAAPAWTIATLFFALSYARSRFLRFIFRKLERCRNA